jgi:serine/threonine protein kinase
MASTERFSNAEYIGEGGMGQVYRVFDNYLAKTCALKLCKHSLSDSEIEASVRESAIWFNFRQFGHVVEVYEILRFESGEIGILMEYIENGSLRKQLNAGNLSMKDKILALYDVSCALMNCLERLPGFCHLDIKPENCLRTQYGLTKLTDFGLASANRIDLSKGSVSFTNQGFLNSIFVRSKFGAFCAGTPPYMSPEQILGSNTISEKSDAYALGVLALEMLSGKHPLAGLPDIDSIFAAHLSGALRQIAQEVLPRVFVGDSAPLIKSLAIDPTNRPSIAEINSFLSANLKDRPISYIRRDLIKLPDPVDETSRTARSLWNMGQAEDAMEYLRRNLEMDPFQADSWFLLAEWNWEYKLQPMFEKPFNDEFYSLLKETCIYGIRALVLDHKYSDTKTREGQLVGMIIPQMTFQLNRRDESSNKLTENQIAKMMAEGYNKWANELIDKQSIWLKEQEKRIADVEGKSRCLCVRCGEVKMFIVMRCPRCGFLPLEIEDLYLTYLMNVFLTSGIRSLNGKEEAPYWIRMNYLRQMGNEIDKNIAAFKREPQFQDGLKTFSQREGAKLLDLLHNGPSPQEINKIKGFVNHVQRQNLADKVKNFFGFSSKK